jgi:SAM-dependent methyltransferase
MSVKSQAAEVNAAHDTLAAQRGVPSLIWRAGQQRRFEMILRWGLPEGKRHVQRILEEGCGTGTYVAALLPYADEVCGIDVEPHYLQKAAASLASIAKKPPVKSSGSPESATPVLVARASTHLQLAVCEKLPYADDYFDMILNHEVIEHVEDDRATAAEMVRVLKPGGRAVIFAPNRLYPFETHGHYWQGVYHFGNTPLINYLPDVVRNRLAPHVRAYTAEGLRSLFLGLPVRVVKHTQIYPGYDNLVHRRPALGRVLRRVTYALEQSPVTIFGISHLLVLEKI